MGEQLPPRDVVSSKVDAPEGISSNPVDSMIDAERRNLRRGGRYIGDAAVSSTLFNEEVITVKPLLSDETGEPLL